MALRAHLPTLLTRAGLGAIPRSSGIVRFDQGGVVKTFRWWTQANVNSIPNNMFVYAIQQDDAELHYLSPLPNEYGFEHGLSPNAIMGQFLDGVDRLTPDNFARNSVFVEFLHGVIAKHGPNCPAMIAEAERTVDGTVSVIDLRVPDLSGAIAPEDIVGLFTVAGGVLGDYHPCPKHQILNQHGIMRLPDWLHAKLLDELMTPT